MTHYVEKPSRELARIFKAAYPTYSGKKLKLYVVTAGCPVTIPRNQWDGGTRESGVIVQLNATTRYSNPPPQGDYVLPPGYAMVTHSIFCGKDHGLTAHIRSDDMTPSLFPPEPVVELTWAERVVLFATKHYKNTYGGKSNIRLREAQAYVNIATSEWEQGKASLIAKGLLNQSGAITSKGKNTIVGRDWPNQEQYGHS